MDENRTKASLGCPGSIGILLLALEGLVASFGAHMVGPGQATGLARRVM